jgi:hypothetical protein
MDIRYSAERCCYFILTNGPGINNEQKLLDIRELINGLNSLNSELKSNLPSAGIISSPYSPR